MFPVFTAKEEALAVISHPQVDPLTKEEINAQ